MGGPYDDAADLVIYLCREESGYITGAPTASTGVRTSTDRLSAAGQLRARR